VATGSQDAEVRDVLSRWERKGQSAVEAGELLGCSERQFRRYRDRYEEEGLARLLDKRLGRAHDTTAKAYRVTPASTQQPPVDSWTTQRERCPQAPHRHNSRTEADK
jgi:transposase